MDNIYRYYLSTIEVVWKPSVMCQSDFTMLLDLLGQAVSGWNFDSWVYAGLNFPGWTNFLRGFDDLWHVFFQAVAHRVCVCGVRQLGQADPNSYLIRHKAGLAKIKESLFCNQVNVLSMQIFLGKDTSGKCSGSSHHAVVLLL